MVGIIIVGLGPNVVQTIITRNSAHHQGAAYIFFFIIGQRHRDCECSFVNSRCAIFCQRIIICHFSSKGAAADFDILIAGNYTIIATFNKPSNSATADGNIRTGTNSVAAAGGVDFSSNVAAADINICTAAYMSSSPTTSTGNICVQIAVADGNIRIDSNSAKSPTATNPVHNPAANINIRTTCNSSVSTAPRQPNKTSSSDGDTRIAVNVTFIKPTTTIPTAIDICDFTAEHCYFSVTCQIRGIASTINPIGTKVVAACISAAGCPANGLNSISTIDYSIAVGIKINHSIISRRTRGQYHGVTIGKY